MHHARERYIDLANVAGGENFDLPSNGRSRHLHLRGQGCKGLPIRKIAGIDEQGKARGCWHEFAQEPEPLCSKLVVHETDTGDVASRPVEACNGTLFDRVSADEEDDRNRCGRLLGRNYRIRSRHNHADLPANELGRQRRQSIILVFRIAILDRHVPAFDVAHFAEAFEERGHKAHCGVGR